ncbi:MAG: transporter [Verrucomicrobiota bacterium]
MALVLASSLCGALVTHAYDLPAVNLGVTSFLDGGPPAGPGFYFTEYGQYYTSHQLNDAHGKSMGLPGADLDVGVSLSQFIYQSDQKVFLDGKWGMDVIVPVVSAHISFDAPIPLRANGTGLGDVVVGPFIQWDPIMGKNGPLFMHRIELQCITPTGKYDRNYAINPGSGYFSFNPYWSGTLFVTPKFTVSTRVHYLWNDSTTDPNIPGATKLQAGQAVHLNFAMDYELIEKHLRAGANLYYLKQFTDSHVYGVNTADRRERVLGVGPGAIYSFNQNNHLFLNAYFEPVADNRPEGMRFVLRYVHHF